MSRVDKCLADAVAAGKITEATAANARGRVQQLLDKGVAEGDAMVRAAEEIAAAAAQRKRQTALRVIAAARTFDQAKAHPRGFAAGVASIFARDAYGLATHSNIEGRAAAIEAGAHARLVNLLDAYRTKAVGFKQDLPGLRRFVAALYGDARDAAAGGFARAWNDVTDDLLVRFNAAGGNLPRRETWRLPQSWDHQAVKAAGRGEFTRFMNEAIQRGELVMRDFDTGAALPAGRAASMIDDAWMSISTNGVADLTPGQPGGVALANKRAQPRAFEWTSAEAYLKFNDKFGVGDAGLFDLLTGHVKGMAKDIAMMEILGPNPAHQARVLMDQARKAEASDSAVHFLGNLWNHTTGQVNSPVNEGVATTMRGIRSWLMGTQLGSAVLSSVTDFSTLQKTAQWNGLPVTGVMQRYVSLLNPANAEDRKTAVRLGLIAQGWTQRAQGLVRHQAEIVGRDLPGRIADTVMRVSGMSAHTQAGKWAFGMEFSAQLADRAGKALADLEPAMRQSFARYGITAEDWDIIRRAGVWEQDGVRFILPEQIVGRPAEAPAPGAVAPTAEQAVQAEAAARQATSRLLEMINTETTFAVVEPGNLEKAIMLGGSRPGTLGGEFRRATAQYKSFPVAMMTRHLMRGIEATRGGDWGRYLATTAVSLTVMGALAIQLKEIAKGKDPRDMTAPGFWGAAFFQGGGAGILGDFLNSAVTRADRGFYMTMVGGPTAGLIDDIAKLTGANIQALAEDKDTNFGRELARFVQKNTPGTSLWYSRLAMDRLLWDRLQYMLDPRAPSRWRQLERRAIDETDQRFWWAPGDTAPERAPSLPALIGGDTP